MPVLVVGLNHRTAPVDLREQLALADCHLRMALEELSRRSPPDPDGRTSPLRESVILSTCNRLEIYAVAEPAEAGGRAIEGFLAHLQNIPPARLRPHLYRKAHDEAAAHLMRVACGLDSQILGEPQIQGQVKQAFQQAKALGATGPVLSALFSRALHAGKRARHETPIGRAATSVSHAAVSLALSTIGVSSHPRMLLVGAGEMIEMAVQALRHRNCENVACINRTYSRAEALARRINGSAFAWRDLLDALIWADVVITGTGAPHTVIHVDDVQPILPRRDGRSLVFVDVAVPRDVERAVGDLPTVRRFDIDDLRATLDENFAHRRAAVPQVEAIVEEELARFRQWSQGRQIVPVIVAMRRKVQQLAEQEMALALQQMPGLDEQTQAIVARMVHRLVNKFLHEPTVQLKAHGNADRGPEYAAMARVLFGLDEAPATPVPQPDGRSPSVRTSPAPEPARRRVRPATLPVPGHGHV